MACNNNSVKHGDAQRHDGNVWCYSDSKGNIEVVLGFGRKELLYDIRNYAYIEGHVMQTDNVHQEHMVQDVGEEGNIDRENRILDLAVSQCKEMLYPYTKNSISRHALHDELKEQDSYGIVLRLPADFSQTTVNLLERLIHEYIVDYAVADWMSITNPQKEETWAVKAADMEERIRTALVSRTGRIRRKPSVFP